MPWKEGNPDLFDALNPYDPTTPAGKFCFNLYAKTSPENKEKMKANIKINAVGNVEAMWKEFALVQATPNGKDILEKDWLIFFLDDAWLREAEQQWWTIFDTPEEANQFIDLFVWGNEEWNKKIWNVLSILWLYWPNKQTGFYGRSRETDQDPITWNGEWEPKATDPKKRERFTSWHRSYLVLTKTYVLPHTPEHTPLIQAYSSQRFKYWISARLQIGADMKTKTIIGESRPLPSEFGYLVLAHRPIQK